MLFNSLPYIFFFFCVTNIFFLTPHRWRWAILLFSSYFFYMSWVPLYASLVALSTIVTYLSVNWMVNSDRLSIKRLNLTISLFVNLGMLIVFKYYSFFSDNLSIVLHGLQIPYNLPTLKLLLPIGISFHTFQTISYTIDAYKGLVQPEKHLGIFALYNCFFPQLVAGPIERPSHLLPQFHKRFDFDYERITDGLKLMAWGFFLKLVIADNLAPYVNKIYSNPQAFSGPSLIIATYFFAFQIYCDFAGYTTIAIGSARVIGFELMENFSRPYYSKSITEFWRRWHISLSSWFRDYLYIPLGGNRVPTLRLCFNIITVFLCCGLWHGAKWTFVVWGGLHGIYLVFSLLTREIRACMARWVMIPENSRFTATYRTIFTFNLVCIGWIFFRANSLEDAWYIIKHLLSNLQDGIPKDENIPKLALNFALITFLLSVELIQSKINIKAFTKRLPFLCRWAGNTLLLLAIWFLGEFSGSDFIYFRF